MFGFVYGLVCLRCACDVACDCYVLLHVTLGLCSSAFAGFDWINSGCFNCVLWCDLVVVWFYCYRIVALFLVTLCVCELFGVLFAISWVWCLVVYVWFWWWVFYGCFLV